MIVLRYKQPDLPRTFRCPGCRSCRWSASVFSIWLISFLDPVTWLRFAIWFLLGLVIYLAYGRRRSRLAQRS